MHDECFTVYNSRSHCRDETGAPSSCLLFTVYMDQMVKVLQHGAETDGFLGRLHNSLLMDDTVVLTVTLDESKGTERSDRFL